MLVALFLLALMADTTVVVGERRATLGEALLFRLPLLMPQSLRNLADFHTGNGGTGGTPYILKRRLLIVPIKKLSPKCLLFAIGITLHFFHAEDT